jgi:hypothetical protein
MRDWETMLADWNRRLVVWNEVYDREFTRLFKKQRGLFRRPSPEQREAAAAEARRLAGEDTMVELFATFDELCGEYLAADLPQDNAKLRAWIGAAPEPFEALWSYVEQAPELIRNADDAERLELALAAVSLDDGRVDALQRDEALGHLWLAARRAGIDPKPAFLRVAAHSNPGTGGGGSQTRQVLENFDRSFHFERHVRGKLSRAG